MGTWEELRSKTCPSSKYSTKTPLDPIINPSELLGKKIMKELQVLKESNNY